MKFSFMAVLMFVMALGVTGCSRNKGPRVITPDPQFSLNVVAVPLDWPLEDRDWSTDQATAERQQQMYHRLGPPDFFFFQWRRDGKPLTSRELETAAWMNRDRRRRDQPFTTPIATHWIYLDEGIFVRFSRRNAEEEPLDDMIRILCEYGDPNEIKETVDATGAPNVVYQYYAEGKVFYFRDGAKYREDDQPRMEGFIRRR